MSKIQLWRLVCCLLLSMGFTAIHAQAQIKISGKVTDAAGKPVASLSVRIKSNSSGTSTDNDGNYSLSTNLKSGTFTIIFSGVGYKSLERSVSVGSATSYNVDVQVEENVTKLDEVVVTGTSQGTTRRQLGSYISTVKADELSKGATGNVLAALQGKTAGAQISQNSGDPAGGISVRLRGISSLSNGEPLYIVDGVIVSNATTRVTNASPDYAGANSIGTVGQNRLSDINPADIERIEVLNGAAAAAIYGSRANAGVIQIFTKRGATGLPQVNFSTSFNVNQIRKKLDVNKAPTKFGGSPDVQTQTILTPTLTNTTNVNRYDYQDYIFHSALGTDNNVSVSGGRDKTKYYASGSYFYNGGIIRNTDFSRYSFRVNLDQELSKWATFNLTTNYIYSQSHEKPDGNTFFSPMNSVTIIGNYYNIQQRDSLGNLKAVGERGRVNPVSVIQDFKVQQQTSRIITGAGLKLTPIKDLTVDYHLGIDNYSQNGTTFYPPYAYNVSTAFYGGGPTLDPAQNGYASAANYTFLQINHDLNVTYNWKISDNLVSVSQAGYTLQYQKDRYLLSQGRGLAPFIQTVNGASTIMQGADNRSEFSIWGEYFQQNFKWRNQLFVTGAIRVDGSSVFGKDQRNLAYKKLSGSYVVSGTDYWDKLGVSGWWDLFKLRAAYGESGNLTGIGAYDRFNLYTASSFLGTTGFQSSTLSANTNMKPERQQEFEVGTDLAFLNNRVGLSFNYYHKKVKDLLIPRQIAPTTGYSSLLDNIGSLQNTGYEIVLNLTPVKTSKFTWDITGIYNHNKNKALNIGSSAVIYPTNGGAPVAIIQGQPIGVFYGSFFARNTDGTLLGTQAGIPLTELGVQNSTLTYTPGRKNGLPDGTTLQKIIGDPNPTYTATLTSDFQYEHLGLHVQFDAVHGNKVFNADFRTRQGVDNGKVAEQEDLGKLPRGYIAGVYGVQEWRIDDGSFVKLREVSLSYSLGKIKCFNDLTFALAGRNLISWDHYKGYDPEVNAAGQSTILRGIDFGSVPTPRTFNVSLRAKILTR